MTSHEMIGGYTNNDKIPMHKLNLDSYQQMRKLITDEMQSIVEWWTELQLRHTSTYGVRVYHRGSMLINHVDRMDTHLASAVLQVSQDVDEDGGWPLNVLLPVRRHALMVWGGAPCTRSQSPDRVMRGGALPAPEANPLTAS